MSLHVKAQGPLQDLPVLLQEIHDDLDTQTAQNEDQHNKDVQYCTDTILSLQNSIADHARQFNTNKQINKDATAALAKLEATLEELNTRLAANEKRTTEGTAQRAQQHDTYEADIADNIDAIDACGQAIQLLNALRSGTSFVQLKNKFSKVSERLQATKSSKHAHIYTPIIKALAQITSKADQEIIGRILDLLTNLQSQLQAAKATIETTETTQAALWETELETLTEEHATLTSQIAQTELDIEDRQETIQVSDEAMKSHINAAVNAANTLTAVEAECKAKEENYQNVKTELSRETEIVQALQDHFNTKLAGLQDYIDNAPAAAAF